MGANQDYTIGKGRLAFMIDVSGLKGKSMQDMGNCPDLTISLDSENLEHFSSRSGLQTKDMDILIKAAFMMAFTLDEPNAENLKHWFMSDTLVDREQVVQVAVADVNGMDDSVGDCTVGELGSWIPLHETTGDTESSSYEADPFNDGTSGPLILAGTLTNTGTEVYDIRIDTEGVPDTFSWRLNGGAWTTGVACDESTPVSVGATGLTVLWTDEDAGTVNDSWVITLILTGASTNRVYALNTSTKPVVKDSGETITYVEGADGTGNYTVDYKAGMLFINPNQPSEAIAVDQVLHVQAAWTAVASIKGLDALTRTEIKGHVMFTGDPPQGRKLEILGYVSLKPTGDLALISEEWGQFQFEAEILEHADYLPANLKVTDFGRVG